MTAALEGGEWSAAHPGRTLPPGITRYALYRRLGGPQGRSGRAENLVPTGIRSRTIQPVAQSLYWLSYPAHQLWFIRSVYWAKHCQLHQSQIFAWAGNLMRMSNDRTFIYVQHQTGWIKKSWKTEIAMGRWSWSRHENIRSEELEEGRPRQRRMSKASKEGQGPPKAVEPILLLLLMMI